MTTYYLSVDEGSDRARKVYELDASSEPAAKKEARAYAGFIGSTLYLYESDPRESEAAPIAQLPVTVGSDRWAAMTDTVTNEVGEICACGCGELTTRTIRALPESDLGTAETLDSARGLLTPIYVADGHEGEHGIDGYANGWGDLSECTDYAEQL